MLDVENLFVFIGFGVLYFVFVGYMDVVLVGDESSWCYGLFDGIIVDGIFYGCGVVDMKGGIVFFVVVVLFFVEECGIDFGGIIFFLIIGDEEGFVINGIVKLLEWVKD